MNRLAAIFAGAGGGITASTAAALLALTLFLGGYIKGAAGVRLEWEAEKGRRAAQAAEVKTDQAEATVKIVTEYVPRIQIVREKGETIIKEVPIYVPLDSCPLPGGFRLLHDAAARGEPADPAGIADAAPVPPADAAATLAHNYTACRQNAEQLTALQTWVQEVTEAGK